MDDKQERIPIYSYTRRERGLYSALFCLLTLIVGVFSILDIVRDKGVTWSVQSFIDIISAMFQAGLSAIVLSLVFLEGYRLISDLINIRRIVARKDAEIKRQKAEADARVAELKAEADARVAELEAEVERLRKQRN